MKQPNLTDYLVKKEDGTESYDLEKYNKDLQSYLDNERRTASETAKAKGIAEGKKKAEEEAKMTEDERVAKALAERENELKSRLLEINKREIKVIYKEAGYSDDEIENLLVLVTEDLDSSKKVAENFATTRKNYLTQKEKELIEKYQGKQPDPSQGGGKGEEKTLAEKYASEYAQGKKEVEKNVYDLYK